MKIKLFTIPNILTMCSLLSGCAAVLFALCINDLQWAFWWIVIAALFDFSDGFAARLLHAPSAVGKELDSLSDCISFGFAPSASLYTMYVLAGGSDLWGFGVFILAAFSALRLAKFNIDENQSTQFIGLPTPASALFFASTGYLMQAGAFMPPAWSILATAAVFSFLLVCNVPMFALKFKHYGLSGNGLRYGFLLLSALGLLLFRVAAVPFIFIAYIAVSSGVYLLRRR